MKRAHRLPRREFLKQTRNVAFGAGLGLALPSVFLNRTQARAGEPPSEFVRVGIIGTGGQGRSNMRLIADHVVAVCDVDQKHLAQAREEVVAKTGKAPATFGDYRKLLESKDVDAVLIGTPDHWHALPAIEACQAGKDVYCEKPLTLTVAEGLVMVKAAQRYQRIIQTGSQQRSMAEFLKACELVRNKRIGKIQTIRVGLPGVNYKEVTVPDSAPPPELDYDMWLGPAPHRPYNKNRVHYNFRFFWDYSGGQMTNWGAHHLDIAQWGMGTDDTGPIEIEGYARYDKEGRYEVPTWFEAIYKYANGVTILCGNSHRIGATFEGEDGVIYVNRGRFETTDPDILKEPFTDKDVRLPVSKNHHQDWFAAIKSRKPPICDVTIGHRSATVCHLGNLAVRLARKLQWDPVKQEIVGDAEASQRLTYAYRAPWKLPDV